MTSTQGTFAKSLQRTDSSGQLNVFIVLRLKQNDNLKIVSRENLPPALRSGKLTLEQKVIIRDQNRNNIEGVIVYMHSDRDQCIRYKNKVFESHDRRRRESVDSMSSSNVFIHSTISNTSSNQTKNSANEQRHANNTKKLSNIQSNNDKSNSLSKFGSQEYCTVEDSIVIQGIDRVTSVVDTSLNRRNDDRFTFDCEDRNSFTEVNEPNNNDIFIDKINELSSKIKQQASLIKERDAEIKRLASTTIEMPTDQVTRDYLCYMAEKIRQQTNKYQYQGNLTRDSNRLGISVVKLNEIISSKIGIPSIARNLFKIMIPESDRTVDHWTKLSEGVLMKEKLLIEFLVRYFGPLQVEPKKIHISLVGCLRNHRSIQKKRQQKQTTIDVHDDDCVQHSTAFIDQIFHEDD